MAEITGFAFLAVYQDSGIVVEARAEKEPETEIAFEGTHTDDVLPAVRVTGRTPFHGLFKARFLQKLSQGTQFLAPVGLFFDVFIHPFVAHRVPSMVFVLQA